MAEKIEYLIVHYIENNSYWEGKFEGLFVVVYSNSANMGLIESIELIWSLVDDTRLLLEKS